MATIKDQLKDRLWAVTHDPDEAKLYASKDGFTVRELFSINGSVNGFYVGLN